MTKRFSTNSFWHFLDIDFIGGDYFFYVNGVSTWCSESARHPNCLTAGFAWSIEYASTCILSTGCGETGRKSRQGMIRLFPGRSCLRDVIRLVLMMSDTCIGQTFAYLLTYCQSLLLCLSSGKFWSGGSNLTNSTLVERGGTCRCIWRGSVLIQCL